MLLLLKKKTNFFLQLFSQAHVLFLFSILAIAASCSCSFNKKVKGNGIITTEERSFGDAKKIKLMGSFDVNLTQGNSKKITITADANLLEFIETKSTSSWLELSTTSNINIKPSQKIKIEIETNELEALQLVGSGNFNAINKFEGGELMILEIAGSGNINMQTNTPTVEATIAGSGDIIISGETQNSKVEIAGSGSYKAKSLMTEHTKVNIAGSGNAFVFASQSLDVNIAGSGDVLYSGNPTVNKKIAGSGKVKSL